MDFLESQRLQDEFALGYCKDVIGRGADDAFKFVKRGVDGYQARHGSTAVDFKKLAASSIYFVEENRLHTASFEEAGSVEDRVDAVIEHLEKAYGKKN